MNDVPNPNDLDITALLSSAVPLLLVSLVLYVYVAATLMVMARKTGTANRWMAWIPILNLFLMCDIGRRSYGWVVMFFIPCLAPIGLPVLFCAMAAAMGRPGWTGILVLVPGINLFLPWYLAAGTPPTSAGFAPRPAGQPVPAFGGGQVCPMCGVPAVPGDRFCGNCGQTIAPAPLVAAPPATVPRPATKSSGCGALTCGVVAVFGVLFLVCSGAAGFFLLRETAYTPPSRQPPQLPPRLAGALTEFPLDTDRASPAKPTSVVTQNFSNPDGSPPSPTQTPTEQLPPGLTRDGLPHVASAMTSVTYRTGPQAPPIYVHVLETPNAQTGAQITQQISQNDSRLTAVNVQSPDGRVYTGTRIEQDNRPTFILTSQTTQICIIIYAPDPAAAAVAQRLASNVGNGRGLMDPEFGPALGVLPAAPPGGFTLQEIRMITGQELLATGNNSGGWNQQSGSQEMVQLATQLQQILPDTITGAKYSDSAGRPWYTLACDFGRPRRANWMFLLFRSIGVGGGARVIDFQRGSALVFDTANQERVLVFCRGPYVVIVGAPANESESLLKEFASSLQL